MAIYSFSDRTTELFFVSGKVAKGTAWVSLKKVAKRKLDMIHYAQILEDLRAPPGNRLEALSGTLSGFHSIRINDQWRVVFKWTPLGPSEVGVCDYH